MGGTHFPGRRATAAGTWAVAVASLLMVVAGGALLAHIALFYYRSQHEGAVLIRRETSAMSRARTSPPAAAANPSRCAARRAGSVAGLLRIPAIGLLAPVVEGSGGLQLADAVGHDPSSSWPGGDGTAVLDGHDVTWFHDLPALQPGDTISYRNACRSVSYRVTSKRVVVAGTAIFDRHGQLDLVTCYPLDALYLTDKRLVVEAVQVPGEGGPSPAPATPRAPGVPGPDVPAPWRAVATLQANPVLLGTLQVNGRPASSWTQSAAPLDAAANAQETYFATIREAEQLTPAAWTALHPAIPYPQVAVLHARSVVSNRASLETTLSVRGDAVLGATITTRPTLDDGTTLTVRATFAVRGATFVLQALHAA